MSNRFMQVKEYEGRAVNALAHDERRADQLDPRCSTLAGHSLAGCAAMAQLPSPGKAMASSYAR